MLERCLVVDDHEMIRDAVAMMASVLGFKEVVTAIDGADAISKIYHLQPSFIITDLQMDPIDGLDMLSLIRCGKYGLPNKIPIIVLTGNAAESIITQCIALDVDGFLVKPVNRQLLQERVALVTQKTKPKKVPEYYIKLLENKGLDKSFESFMEKSDPSKKEASQDSTQPLNDPLARQYDPSKNGNYIIWQDKFSVCNDELDESNKLLLAIINETYEEIINNNKNNPLIFDKLAARLRDYLELHFTQEEKILKESQYPQVDNHIEMHNELVKQADFILLKCQADARFYPTDFFK
ncbi:MAG: response regulator, partial [Vibrionaceae bacterium]